MRNRCMLETLKLVVFLLGLSAVGLAQTQSKASPQAQSAVIRVTAPQPHARLTANYVTVRYELLDPTNPAAGSPNFKTQLDGNDPVTTATTEQNFTGLTPGQHVITVQLVDANGTPAANSQTEVPLVVVPTPQNSGAQNQNPGSSRTSSPVPQASLDSGASKVDGVQLATAIPQTGSVLPIVSIVGFGVLVGGIVSAIKTQS